ncbi:tobamovirus multiplication protein 1-like [Malus domestica]|uniref:tobamovirus multiplication protein 1-like n=1 Tax=Malus domestica TaxID=3750 RepID=UPI003975A1BE
MISRKGLVFNYSGGGGGGGGSYDWWNQDQKQWESSGGGSSSTYYILCASYGLVSLVALVQLGRIQLRVPEYGWTIQKVFHLMNFLVNGLRALLFGVYKAVFLIKPKALEMLLFMDLPGLLFFSTYTLLVLFWAEIYHQARSLPTDKLRPAYYVINGFVYFTQVCIWILLWLSRSPVAVEVARLFFSVISFCTALGFLIYGGRLFIMLRHFPIESRGRQKKLEEVGWVTGICCTCFLIRCIVLAVSAFDKDADVDVIGHPILNLVYYMSAEIVPSALVLFILRKLPPRRVSDQYQPIS